MNAKEFAHKLEKAASFIRQQQAEIEALKQIIDANNLNQNIGQFVKPTNEPVAWIDKSKLDDWLHGDCYPDQCFIHYQANDAIPLYTHPVKELTDEEIANTWDDVRKDATLKPSMKDMQDFARAIMKRCGIISGTDK